MEKINKNEWNSIRKKIDREADKVNAKIDKGKLISSREAALLREKELYEEMDKKREEEQLEKAKAEKQEEETESAANKEEEKEPEPDNNSGKDEESAGEAVNKEPDGNGAENETEPSAEPGRENFDINNKEQQIELIKESKVYFAEKLGRNGNLEKAFGDFEKDNTELLDSFRGKDILLKANLVDPDNPQSCTSAETVKKLIELFKKYEPGKIYVGDVPSGMGKRDRSWDELKKVYESPDGLSYQFGDDAELIDLEEFNTKTVKAGGKDYNILNLDRFGGIVNIAKPKMHGEFGYTGCTKNLMGFMDQDSRSRLVHMHEDMDGGGEYSEETAGRRINEFSSAFLKDRPDIINVNDGYDFVIGHEHLGIEKKTDFATISRDPFSSDREAVNLIGLNEKRVSYLNRGEFPARSGILEGSVIRKDIYSSGLEKKTLPYEAGQGGTLSFIDIINDPEFLSSRETQTRTARVVLDSLYESFKSRYESDSGRKFDLSGKKEILKAISGIAKNTAKYDYKSFYDIVFADIEFDHPNREAINKFNKNARNNNPYDKMPEFKDIFLEWLKEKE